MFSFASAFNQPLSDWDTSKGTDFVSNQNKRFCMSNTKYHTRWPQGFVFYFIQQQLYLILDSPSFSTFALIPIDNRIVCSLERLCLTKTCVVGMFPIQPLLLLQWYAQMMLFVVKTEPTVVELIDERINNICVWW